MSPLHFISPYWTGAWDAIVAVLPFLAALMTAEVAIAGRALRWKNICFNLALTPCLLTAGFALHGAAYSWTLPWISLGNLAEDIQPAGAAALAIAYLVAFDLLYYGLHRLQHAVPWLWQFHAFHHSDDEMSASTATRHHWLEEFFRFFTVYAPLLIVFGHLNGPLPWLGVCIGVYGLFIHSNLPLNWAWLNRWIVTPQYHRLHHSLESNHRDCNFAVFFPVIDFIFRSQQLPRKKEFPATGLQDTRVTSGLRLLIMPWPLPKK